MLREALAASLVGWLLDRVVVGQLVRLVGTLDLCAEYCFTSPPTSN
jgi:hypothetical protein